MNIINEVFGHSINNKDRTAFISQKGRLSYEELWRRSDNLAGWIDLQTDDRKTPVIVYGHKDPMMIVCFLACVKSGHPYCPVDASVPAERLMSIVDLLGDPLILVAHHDEIPYFDEHSNVAGYDAICRISDMGVQYRADGRCQGEDILYIIFTSGSTGLPKGVQVTANNLNSFLKWASTLAGGIEPGSVFLNQAPYSFDLSVMDLYLALATGGTIVSIEKQMQQGVGTMIDYLSDNNIEYWVSTPSFADLCLSDPGFVWTKLPEIRAFIFCGEVLTIDTARRLKERFPGVHIINTYGPTEATVCVTEVEITDEHIAGEGMLPVGRPAPGTWITVDPDSSEVIITGPTVSAGYYKDPERTLRAFSINGNGRTVSYRTGDIGHFDDNGMLFIDGRLDNQIKLRGYRMELEDIESNLEMLECVKKAVVLPHYREGRVDSLTAYIMCREGAIDEDYSGRKRIRRELGERLPAYMVPKRIRFIDEFPLNDNGKLDRKQLAMENLI